MSLSTHHCRNSGYERIGAPVSTGYSNVTMCISGISFDGVECVDKRKTVMARERSIYLSRADCSVVRREKSGERARLREQSSGYSDENRVEKG